MSYPLGTVFAYGRADEFKDYSYTEADDAGQGLVDLRLYYKFLYIPSRMLYDGIVMKGMAQSERRNSEWIATLLPCVMNVSNSCCALLNKNCALLCFALK